MNGILSIDQGTTSSRAIIYASEDEDFESAVRLAASETREQIRSHTENAK